MHVHNATYKKKHIVNISFFSIIINYIIMCIHIFYNNNFY
jgi:hypothetical protein